jgi:hypothetical protein
MPDRGVEVHEEPVAQPRIHHVLAGDMVQREVAQGGLFVGRVMVDVHVRILRAALLHVGEEVQKGLPFARSGVSPERPEDRFVAWRISGPRGLNHAEEVLQAPLARRILPERVAFEVEEDVAVTRGRNAGQRIVCQHLVRDGVRLALLHEGT